MKRLKSKSRYQFISFLHELLLFLITSFVLFPSRVKRIIFCFVYSEDHYPSCMYSCLEEEILQPCIADVGSVVLPQPIHKDDHRVPFPSESEQPCDFGKIEIVSNPVQTSSPLAIISEPDQQLTTFYNPPTAFQVKIRMKIFKPLKLPLLLHPYPDDCYEYLPWFSGENQTSAERHVESFLDFIDRFSIAHEDVIMRMFSKSLIKDAATWFKGLRADSIGSWIEFSNVFLKYWGEYKSLDSYLADFYALKREQNEALPVFNRRFYRVYHDIPSEVRPTETAALIHYVTCLHSELALLLLERKSSSLSQLFENAQEVEENIRASRRIQMQDDSENLQTYEQEDCQYTSDFEQESNEFETNLDQRPEGEYISDSESDSSVCAEYSRDRHDYEVYDQFANQNKPMITNDRIENYMFLADHNPHHLDMALSSSTEDRSGEGSEFEVDLDQQREGVQLFPEEDSLPFPDLQGLSNLQLEHENQEHVGAVVDTSHESLDLNDGEDTNFKFGSAVYVKDSLLNLQTERNYNRNDKQMFISAYDSFESVTDHKGISQFQELQQLKACSRYQEEDKELNSPEQQSIVYVSSTDLEQPAVDNKISKSSLKQLFISQFDQQRERVFHHVFNDPFSDFLESMNNIKVKIFLIDESWFCHLFKTYSYVLWLSSSLGSRSKRSINKFLIWLHWKSSFT